MGCDAMDFGEGYKDEPPHMPRNSERLNYKDKRTARRGSKLTRTRSAMPATSWNRADSRPDVERPAQYDAADRVERFGVDMDAADQAEKLPELEQRCAVPAQARKRKEKEANRVQPRRPRPCHSTPTQ